MTIDLSNKMSAKTSPNLSFKRPKAPQANRYVVIDFETTGFHPNQGHRVIEIGAVEIVNNQIKDSYQTLINPGIEIPRAAENVHRISNAMIAGAPQPEPAFKDLLSFIGGSTIVAHNIQFELAFMHAEFRRIGENPTLNSLCTLHTAHTLYPTLRQHTLGYLLEHFGIKPTGPLHRALPDAQCTAELLLIMRKDDISGKTIP